MTNEDERNKCSPDLIEQVIGAFRHLLEKNSDKGFPVGFSIVFYNPDSLEKTWYFDMRVIGDSHDPNILNVKVRERVGMVNQFLARGVATILEGEHDYMITAVKEKNVFYVPGIKGKA